MYIYKTNLCIYVDYEDCHDVFYDDGLIILIEHSYIDHQTKNDFFVS